MRIDDAEIITSDRLVQEAETGSAPAIELLEKYARNIAVGIANLQQTMSLYFYILHGDAATGGRRLSDLIQHNVRDFVLALPNQVISVVCNGLVRATPRGSTCLREAQELLAGTCGWHHVGYRPARHLRL